MQSPRTLDDVLDDARVTPRPPHDDPGGDEEAEWTSRRLLAEDYAAVRGGAAQSGFPHPALGPARPGTVPRREQAARDLRLLSSWTIHSPHATQHITRLATQHVIDPDSALVFACLLHLAGSDQSAEPLWQFAAGADKAVAAECLSLHHTTRGELRRALHWAQQAATLDTPDQEADRHEKTTAPVRRGKPLTSLMLLRLWRALRGGHDTDKGGGGLTIGTFHAYAGTLSRALTVAIQGLKTEPIEFGILWPDDTLARHLVCFID